MGANKMSAGTISEKDFLPALINEGEDQRVLHQHIVQGTTQVSTVYDATHISNWQIEAVKKILDFENLPDNWDSYGSEAPNEVARQKAIDFILMVPSGKPEPIVLPLSGGAIQIGWRKRGRGVQLEFLPDGSIEYLLIQGGEPEGDGGVLQFISPSLVSSISKWLVSS
jgi:hypothetical protein